jgi:phosphatidylglycerophosphate synthase
MGPAIITALLLVVMLLIIASLLFSAWRAYRRHKQEHAASLHLPSHPLDRHVTAILRVQSGVVVGIEEPDRGLVLPGSWYRRRRTLVSLGFITMILLTLLMQGSLVDGPLHGLTQGLGFSFFRKIDTPVQSAAHVVVTTASMRVDRIDSAARSQYYTDYQWRVWSYSSCSGIAMATAMNAYGRHLIAADVLQRELDLGVWNVQLGLLREDGIALTASTYGFNTDWGHAHTLQDIIRISNAGSPVIVSVRDTTYYPGGHIFVIHGGDSQFVYIADSSPLDFQRMTIPMFLGMWQGFSAILTPR